MYILGYFFQKEHIQSAYQKKGHIDRKKFFGGGGEGRRPLKNNFPASDGIFLGTFKHLI